VEIDHRWEGSVAFRPIEPRDQPGVAMTEVFDIFGREFMGVIRHLHSLPGLVCCIGGSGVEADLIPYSLAAQPKRRQAQHDFSMETPPADDRGVVSREGLSVYDRETRAGLLKGLTEGGGRGPARCRAQTVE